MENEITITRDLKFKYSDLMRYVDLTVPFTLDDILNIVLYSKIPMKNLKAILRCGYIESYCYEAILHNRDVKKKELMNQLVLQWNMESNSWKGKRGYSSDWSATGRKKGGRINYSISLSHIEDIKHCQIVVKNNSNYTKWSNYKHKYQDLDFRPCLTLLDLLYAVFWELSFHGNRQHKDKFCSELDRRMKDVKSGKTKLIPWSKVKKDLKARLKEEKK